MNRWSERPVVAVVGCGRWGRNIVRDLLGLECAVIAVDPTDTARAAALDLGASAAAPDLSTGVAGATVHGVVIAAPTRLHARLTLEALDLGVPVFVEKPMTDNVATARSLVDHGGDRLFVMHKWHYHPGIEALARLADEGLLGRVHGVTSERVGEASRSEDTDTLWLLGPHEVTIGARVLGGFPDRVVAVADVIAGQLRGVDVIARWLDGRWHRWTISTRPEPVRRRVLVHGSNGYAILSDAYAAHLEVFTAPQHAGSDPQLVPIERDPPLERELRAFVAHLLGGPPLPTTGSHGLAVVEILDEVRSSAGLPPQSNERTVSCV